MQEKLKHNLFWKIQFWSLLFAFSLQDAINIAPFRRQIRVVDKNDNAPEFVRNVYKFDVDETEPVGKTLFTEIAISDQDEGANSVVKLGTIHILRNHFYGGGGQMS